MLLLAASLKRLSCHTRDITKAYTQSVTSLERDAHNRLPPEISITSEKLLKLVKPLYEALESGLHWYLIYMEHQTGKLGICRSRADPFLPYKHNDGELECIVILQVAGSLIDGTETFLNEESFESKSFMSNF